MDTILQIVRQEDVEKKFNRKLIDGYIREFIENDPGMQAKVEHGVQLVEEYMGKVYSYESKNTRITQLKGMDVQVTIVKLFVGIAYCQNNTLYTSITAQLAGRLGFDDKTDSIRTVAELLAVLCLTDAFDIVKENAMASLMVISRIPLPEDIVEAIRVSQYLPPMVCEPLELTSNYSSGYLSHKDSLILGKGNHHDGDICLDVLNTINRIPLKLDMGFLCNVEENPNREFTLEKVHEKALAEGGILTDAEARDRLTKQIANWESFKHISQEIYLLMHQLGNRFFLTNKVDKRGRIYCSGYHISTQGTAYKKAMIELAEEELITGVPNV